MTQDEIIQFPEDTVDVASNEKTSRRRTRELALSCCFEIEFGNQDIQKIIERTIESQNVDKTASGYLENAVATTERFRTKLDEIITELAVGWKLDRIAKVDLCILRLAITELVVGFEDPTPPDAIIINEAVVLAKKFSTEDSGRFVNGILATVAKDKPRFIKILDLT
ncbi:MAG TPA: transcription antitermination factor NusB [Firmicutes bacterium]|nr:transcription antitermination factor NusB [Bacillota bacterium]